MQQQPFDKPGTFWRGNLHTHSSLSDGLLSPELVCAQYRQAGYDFISLTDHFQKRYNFPLADTRAFRSDNFTTVLGAELHAGQTEIGSVWHILAVGLPLDFAAPAPNESGPELAARAMNVGAYVAVAHPHWYALTERDIDALGEVDAIEIFNGIAVDANDRADSWHMADIMLGRGKRYTVCATDDYHAKVDHHDFVRGWVWVKSETLEPGALLAALKAGHYYSSTGPQIHDMALLAGNKLRVRCSPADRIFVTGTAASSQRCAGAGIVEAEFDLGHFDSPYVRVTVRDAQGGRAWSNPIWL